MSDSCSLGVALSVVADELANRYSTYRAMLFYLYTGTINLASTLSDPTVVVTCKEGTIDARGTQHRLVDPKEVYRLADKLDLAELKQLAFKHIVKNLTVDNVRPLLSHTRLVLTRHFGRSRIRCSARLPLIFERSATPRLTFSRSTGSVQTRGEPWSRSMC